MIGRTVVAMLGPVVLAAAAAVTLGAAPAQAQRTTGWATWSPITGSSNQYETTMQLPAAGFPEAAVTSDSRGPVQLPGGTSTFLGGTGDSVPTPVGTKYGSSRGHSYLNLRPEADAASTPSTTTYAFDAPTPSTGWAFVLGDVDADQVRISAADADGTPLTPARIAPWFRGTFNYAGDTDEPRWEPGTATLVGNPAAADTNGASGWFEPDVSLSRLTFVFTRRAGFPVYQTWFASEARTISGTVTDVSQGGPSCPVGNTTLHLIAPDGSELDTTSPDPDGDYTFGEYAPRTGYTVRLDWPADCAAVGTDMRTVDNSTSDATADFSVRRVVPEAVSGTVTLADGTPVAGVELTLTPPGGGTPTTVRTDADGRYIFDNNQDGAGYTVAVTDTPHGFAVTGPDTRTFDIAGAAVTMQDFKLAEQAGLGGTITGGGGPLGGVTVTLTPSQGGPAVTTTTDGDGHYFFEHLPSGDYDISVAPPDGYRAPPPRSGVTVGTSAVTGQDFELTRPGAIGGAVTDATHPDAPSPLPDATVTIDGPNGPTTHRTDADGRYFQDDLDAGNYTATLTVPDGFTATGPTRHPVTITAAGEILGAENFTVREPAPPTSPPPSSNPPSSPPPSSNPPSSTPPSSGSSSGHPTHPATTAPTTTGGAPGSTTAIAPPPASNPPPLAGTGVPTRGLLGIAAMLVLAGFGLLFGVSRRRGRPPRHG